ncbi:PWWP domain-containing protein 5 isoform X1 [Capsicum annuum]|uniref:PWWP domain-containing protein 5 isoform X1 n=2 Tax=Capsicum annuum TaxID=4072 RepID=UPI001FB0720B|nr:PWWP domain-containing protein 5 isoform X1 [Capsicum annuum]
MCIIICSILVRISSMLANSDHIDPNSGVVNAEARNEGNVVSVDHLSENETMENQNNQGFVCESVISNGVRVSEDGNQVVDGLREQMEGLDVEIDLGSGEVEGQMGFFGYDGLQGELVVDLSGFSHLTGKGNAGNESIPDGITVNNDSKVVDVNSSIGIRPDALIPERRGVKNRKEEEGKYYLSDLVWGKVRTHPWWPGQILEPSAASEKAMKYFKKNSYLISYFGDQTFAWSEASSIKPFRMYFSQMEKQSNSESFSYAVNCALDEISRQVEFGLACPCLLEETQAEMKSQIVVDAGIQAESSMRTGGDNLSDETSFNPTKLVRTLKSVAAAPHSRIDRLAFVLAKAQLEAFNRWKGYYDVPVIDELSDLLENDDDAEPLLGKKDASYVTSEENSNVQGTTSTKRSRCSGIDEHPSKKEKLMSILMYGGSSGIPNDQKKSRGKVGRERKSVSSEKRHLTFDYMPNNSKAKRRKKELSPSRDNKMSLPSHKAASRIRKSIERNSQRTSEHSEKSRNVGSPEGEQLIPKESPSPTEMLSKLYSAAKDPMNAYSILMSQAGWFCDYRNLTCSETAESGDHPKTTEKHVGQNSSNSVSAETLSIEGIEDSYWTDRIIQCNPEDQVLFEPEVQNEEDFPDAKWDSSPGLSPSLDNKQEVRRLVEYSERENLSDLVDGNSEYSPTALILNFSDLDSIPPIAELNIIFSQYGPLCVSETELFHKSKRAKVVFKRRADAETAFSSSGKFSIFGPSLISYRLEYSPSPHKASCTPKRKRKYTASLALKGV